MAENLGTVTFPLQRLEETLSKFTVPELQQQLKRRGLKRSGVKAKLIQRLKEAIENEQDEQLEAEKIPDADVSSQSTTENDDSMVNEDAHLPPAEVSEEWNDGSGVRDSSQPEEEHDQEEKSYSEKQITGQQPMEDNLVYGGFAEDAKEPELPEYEDSEVALQQKEGMMDSEVQEEEEAHVEEEETYPEADEASAKTGETYAKMDETYAKTDETYAETNETFAKTDETYAETGETYATREEDHSKAGGMSEIAAAEPDAYQEDRRKEEVTFVGNHGEDEENHVESEMQERDESEIHNKHSEAETDVQMDTDMTDYREEKDGTIEIKVSHDDKVDIEDSEEQTEKEVKKPEKKHTTPVQIKKRKLTTDSDQTESKTENAADKPKKRKWGSSASRESLTISSDSLKALIPDVPILPPSTDDPLGLGLDYGEMEEGEIDDSYGNEQAEAETENKGEEESLIKTEGSFKKEVRKGRIVRINTKDTVKIKTSEVKEEVEEIAEKENGDTSNIEMPIDQKVSLLPEISTEESHEERERSPSPAKNNPSQILSIFNLVRPFTLRQLRELLSKTGSVVEEGFWINKIKSHCYVTYDTVEEAIASRNALHGTKWPSGNPKFLSVDFAVNDVMYRETEGKLGTAPSPSPAPKPKEKERHRRDDDESEEEKRGRERQRKEREKHRHHEKENKEEEHSKQKEKKEAPAKLLDDLFRKTKATPCIYWLPLTKDQIAAKEIERELRRNQRQKEIDAEKTRQENQRKQRETEFQRQRERSRERQNPPPSYRSRRDSKSPPKMINRSPELPRRGIRSLPAQYRRRSPSSSSSSS